MLKYRHLKEEQINDEQPQPDNDANNFVVPSNNSTNFVPAILPRESQSYSDEFAEISLRGSTQVTTAPKDFFNVGYITFYVLGIGTMIPWNFFITAEDYWMYKFRNTTLNETSDKVLELTPMQKSFACDLTLTASVSGTFFLIIHAVYGQQVALRIKILGTLCVTLSIFALTTALVEANTDNWQEQFFCITLVSVIILNVCSAIMSGALFGTAALMPSEYMTATVSGQALGGILTALTFLMILTFGADPKITAFVYFIIGSVLIVLNILCYYAMERTNFFQYYIKNEKNCMSQRAETPELEPSIGNVLTKIYIHAVTMFMLFSTTLSVYPSVSALMQSERFGLGYVWNDLYYMPVMNYLIFNCGDYFGRILAGTFIQYLNNNETILLIVLMRMLYVPFFLCSNSSLHHFLPVLVHSDIAYGVMMITFSITNGFLANMLFLIAPRSVNQYEKEMASSIMVASLSCGIAFGSILSIIFVHIL